MQDPRSEKETGKSDTNTRSHSPHHPISGQCLVQQSHDWGPKSDEDDSSQVEITSISVGGGRGLADCIREWSYRLSENQVKDQVKGAVVDGPRGKRITQQEVCMALKGSDQGPEPDIIKCRIHKQYRQGYKESHLCVWEGKRRILQQMRRG